MTDNDKFFSDVKRIIKYDRSSNNGIYNGIRASKAISELFIQQNKDLSELPNSIAEYWLNNYILNSKDSINEPTDAHIEWLYNALCLLNGTFTKEQNFSKTDWVNLKDIINYEAEELPIELLSSLMTILVERGIL